MIFHLLGRHVCQERGLQNFFISLLYLTDMLSLVQEQFQREGWNSAYHRCKQAPGGKYKYHNRRKHLNGARLKQLRMYESRETSGTGYEKIEPNWKYRQRDSTTKVMGDR